MATECVEIVVIWDGELLAWEHLRDGVPLSPELVGLAAGVDLELLVPSAPPDGRWLAKKRGRLAVHARRSPLPPYPAVRPPLDRPLAGAMTGAMTVGLLFLFAIGFVPPAGAVVVLEALRSDSALVAYVRAPPEDSPVPRVIVPRDGNGPITDADGQRMAEDVGVAGADDGPRTRRGRIRFSGRNEATRRIPRAQIDPLGVGVLGVLRSVSAPVMPGAIAGAEDVPGWTRDDAYGRSLAQLVGAGHGTGGFDMIGTGRGGCLPGDEECGQGTVGFDGRGFGGVGWGTTCDDTCEGMRAFGRGTFGGIRSASSASSVRGLSERESRPPPGLRRVRIRAEDGLSRSQIRRVVRRHREEVRHCYADTFAPDGARAGRVEVSVGIGVDGGVVASEVTEDALGDADVASCIANAVRRWRFPTADAATVASLPFHLEVPGAV